MMIPRMLGAGNKIISSHGVRDDALRIDGQPKQTAVYSLRGDSSRVRDVIREEAAAGEHFFFPPPPRPRMAPVYFLNNASSPGIRINVVRLSVNARRVYFGPAENSPRSGKSIPC